MRDERPTAFERRNIEEAFATSKGKTFDWVDEAGMLAVPLTDGNWKMLKHNELGRAVADGKVNAVVAYDPVEAKRLEECLLVDQMYTGVVRIDLAFIREQMDLFTQSAIKAAEKANVPALKRALGDLWQCRKFMADDDWSETLNYLQSAVALHEKLTPAQCRIVAKIITDHLGYSREGDPTTVRWLLRQSELNPWAGISQREA